VGQAEQHGLGSHALLLLLLQLLLLHACNCTPTQ
jgi:hypothetical protein